MDNFDVAILNCLRLDARISNQELAQHVHLSPAAVLTRVRHLTASGVIQRYETRLDPEQLQLNLMVFIKLKTSENIGDSTVGRQLVEFPEILEIFDVSGEYNYLLKVLVADSAALRKLMTRIGKIPGITSSETTLVLQALKAECAPRLSYGD